MMRNIQPDKFNWSQYCYQTFK